MGWLTNRQIQSLNEHILFFVGGHRVPNLGPEANIMTIYHIPVYRSRWPGQSSLQIRKKFRRQKKSHWASTKSGSWGDLPLSSSLSSYNIPNMYRISHPEASRLSIYQIPVYHSRRDLKLKAWRSSRVVPLAGLNWCTYCRFLRMHLKCHFLQIELNNWLLCMLQ
jgi:hypothetical protein